MAVMSLIVRGGGTNDTGAATRVLSVAPPRAWSMILRASSSGDCARAGNAGPSTTKPAIAAAQAAAMLRTMAKSVILATPLGQRSKPRLAADYSADEAAVKPLGDRYTRGAHEVDAAFSASRLAISSARSAFP